MGEQSALIKNFSEFGGNDYRSNDVTRKPRFSRQCQNVEYLKNNSISVVKGQKGRASTKGGGGTFNYIRDNAGVTVEQLVTIDSNLHRLLEGAITITYTGTNENVSFQILPDRTAGDLENATFFFSCKILEGDTVVFNQNLGIGRGEVSPFTIAQLVTAIDNLLSFTCVASGDTSGPAAFLPNVTMAVTSGGSSFSFDYWEQIYCPTTNPFSSFAATFNTQNFQLASFLNTSNRLFIATGINELYKYDGVAVYRAGVPTTTGYNATVTANTGNPNGTYESFITYEYVDGVESVVDGDPSNKKTTTPASKTIQHTIPFIQANTGFLTSQAKVNGNQTGAVITVDSGHTLKAGMTVFLVDNTTLVESERKVISTTATTITLNSSVTVVDDQIMSVLRVLLWRNRAGSTELSYLVRSFANDSTTASVTYEDNRTEAQLVIEYDEPIAGHGLPPVNLKYLTSYKGLLIGNTGKDDKVYFSDPDGPEFFANGISSVFNLRSKSSNPVRGLGSNREILVAFKENETHLVNGDLPNGNYRQEILADAIGTPSHHSIVDVDGTLWFHTLQGPKRIVGNNLPDDISYRIAPAFTSKPFVENAEVVHSRVVAVDVSDLQLVLFYYPCETSYQPNDNSFVMAADYRSQQEVESDYDEQGRVINQIPNIRWWRWTGFNLAGGATIYRNELTWSERRYLDSLAAFQYTLCRRLENNDQYDYTNFAGTYDWDYEAGWTDLGQPDLLKKFLRASVYSFPEGVAPSFSIDVSTELDFLNGQTHSLKRLTYGSGGVSSGWGTWAWDSIGWGEAGDVKRIFEFLLTRASAIKMRFSSKIWCEQPVITGWTIEAVAAYKPKVIK